MVSYTQSAYDLGKAFRGQKMLKFQSWCLDMNDKYALERSFLNCWCSMVSWIVDRPFNPSVPILGVIRREICKRMNLDWICRRMKPMLGDL